MVRISSTVLTVLVGLTSLSRATAVDDVVRYADELREDVFPPVKTAVEDLPGSSSELQVCHVVAIQAGFVNVALQNEKIGEAVMNTTNLDFIQGGRIFCKFQAAHHVLMELINGIVSKNSSFIEDKAWLRAPMRAQLTEMRAGHDAVTKTLRDRVPEILKEHVQALNNDGDQQLAIAQSAFDPLK
ncbi:hypothetical protein AAF712_002985 [Marasmius tenuissimus]|uniref:Secreted protein n=1 Tax=Marasmius tenuissimus TaxID=585030 RepID=A0ABR3A729_9AGAR